MTGARVKFKYIRVGIMKKQIAWPIRKVSKFLNVILIICYFTISYENEGRKDNCLLISVIFDGKLTQIFF